MSWSISLIGRDKEKLKAAIRDKQCKDEEKNPHGGVPRRVADHLCSEVDRCRIYEWDGRKFALKIDGSGSFHEQGSNETITIGNVELVE
jgi:hypothetical protein